MPKFLFQSKQLNNAYFPGVCFGGSKSCSLISVGTASPYLNKIWPKDLKETEDIYEKVALDSKFHISSLKICPETNVRTEAQSWPYPKPMKFSQNTPVISKDWDQALKEPPATIQTPNNKQDRWFCLLFPVWQHRTWIFHCISHDSCYLKVFHGSSVFSSNFRLVFRERSVSGFAVDLQLHWQCHQSLQVAQNPYFSTSLLFGF